MNKIMNRIGIAILTIAFFVSTAAQCQFFWSHNGVSITPVVGCVEYGYLYNGYSIRDTRDIANTGWHIPTTTEFTTLLDYYGGQSVAGDDLKESDTLRWNIDNGTNTSGFTAVGNGWRDNTGVYSYLKEYGYIWTSTTFGSDKNFAKIFQNASNDVPTSSRDLQHGFAVRLLKDATTLSHGETGTYTGNDGKTYLTICVGTQEWLSENLAETQYRNGDPIPTVENATTWEGLTTGAKCAYNNDYTNVGCDEAAPSTGGTVKYGYLYNWYAVTDSSNIANDGWRMTLSSDFDALRVFLTASVTGDKLRETGTTYWLSPNTLATNEVGFNGRGGGNRNSTTGFVNLKDYGYYRVSNKSGSYFVSYFLRYNQSSLGSSSSLSTAHIGQSVRLVKESTTLTHGQTGTYTGNDGRVYNTICINGVEWLAENLAETLYRDGTPIPTVTDATTWSGLTTGAKCAYDNLESNVFE